MKKIIFTLGILLLLINFSQAQIKIGGGLWYATDIDNPGISVNANYDINEQWIAAPSFSYIFPKNEVNWSMLDLDANYIFTELENVGKLYALAGLNITFWSFDFKSDYIDLDTNGSNAGINIGAGLLLQLNEKLQLAPEIKYTLGDGDFLRLGVKVLIAI